MTTKEWAAKAAKACTGESCTREICVHVAEDTIWEAIQEQIAISDIHGVRDRDEIERLTLENKARRETILSLERERDESLRTGEGRREQLSRLACEKTIEWKRAENAKGIIAQRDRRIAELEAALHEAREWMGCLADPDEATYKEYITDKRFVDAALSRAPAQPATPESRVCLGCGHFKHSNRCNCGCTMSPVDIAQPATAAKSAECARCEDEGSKVCVCGNRYARPAAPPSPAAREAMKCRCGHERSRHDGEDCAAMGGAHGQPYCPCDGFAQFAETSVPAQREATITFSSYREDGWPLCPQCGDDELYTLANWPGMDRPSLSWFIERIDGCYHCNWKPASAAVISSTHNDAVEGARFFIDGYAQQKCQNTVTSCQQAFKKDPDLWCQPCRARDALAALDAATKGRL